VATNRRVTVVNPWIPGGEGQWRDLIPMPPILVLLVFRPLGWLFKHPLLLLLLTISLTLFLANDWPWWGAFIIFPLLCLFARLLLTTLWLWYRNPNVPFFARKTPR
jgi:hypothetical protein